MQSGVFVYNAPWAIIHLLPVSADRLIGVFAFEGGQMHPTQTVPFFSTASRHPTCSNACNFFNFHAFTDDSLDDPGVGALVGVL